MARAYAQIITAIWRDEDFTALPHDEQWMYLLLNTQPDISAAGVLTLAVTRWAKRSPTMKPEIVNDLLDRLAAKRFLVIDRDTDEVLVRTFIRWDRGYGNIKRQPAIRDAIDAVESESIINALAAEVDRVGMPVRYRGQADRAPDSLSAEREWPDVTTIPESISTGEFPQVDSLSNGYADAHPIATDSHAASERRVPQPTTRNPQPATQKQSQDQNLLPPTPLAADDGVIPGTEVAVADKITKPKRGSRLVEGWVPSEGSRKWAREKYPGVDLRTEHEKFTNYWLAKAGRDATKLDWDRTWQNWITTAAERLGGRVSAAPALPDGRTVNRKTAQHFDHLAAYGGDPDA